MLIVIAAVLIIGIIFIYNQNTHLAVKRYALNAGVSRDTRIVHMSDLHSARFGRRQHRLIALVRRQRPDIIAFTGDIISRTCTDVSAATELMEGLAGIAPVYYIPGNHELRSGLKDGLFAALNGMGVNILAGKTEYLPQYDITLIGLDEPPAVYTAKRRRHIPSFRPAVEHLSANAAGYRVILAHHPEAAEEYLAAGAGAVLCGHTHGGMIRLPCVGGLYAPDQGLFPKYSAGLYTLGPVSMTVSGGLGNSFFLPARVFNYPSVSVIELKVV